MSDEDDDYLMDPITIIANAMGWEPFEITSEVVILPELGEQKIGIIARAMLVLQWITADMIPDEMFILKDNIPWNPTIGWDAETALAELSYAVKLGSAIGFQSSWLKDDSRSDLYIVNDSAAAMIRDSIANNVDVDMAVSMLQASDSKVDTDVS